ncbi:hypothetical protein TNCV_276561 [Trichonephila clavipes]|nr:hypothetical protein TNCV_276561 [Trichonephila clavipes]
MYKDTKNSVRSCTVCLSRKNAFKIPPAPHQPVEQSQEPGEMCHIDIFGPLKTTPKGEAIVKIYRFWNSGAGGARRLRRMQTKEGGSPPPDLNREDGMLFDVEDITNAFVIIDDLMNEVGDDKRTFKLVHERKPS